MGRLLAFHRNQEVKGLSEHPGDKLVEGGWTGLLGKGSGCLGVFWGLTQAWSYALVS